MGRPAEGFSIRYHRGQWRVRWTNDDGTRPDIPTGIRDPGARGEATRAGRKLFAASLRGEVAAPEPREPVQQREPTHLETLTLQWVAGLSGVRPNTRAGYELTSGQWPAVFRTVRGLTGPAIAAHVRQRLAMVRGKTVRNELSALRGFLDWLVEIGELSAAPPVPSVKASVAGTKHPQRRRVRAPDLSPEEVERFLAALPERSAREGWIVRDRLVLAFETTLRPETLHKLRTPENYVRGSPVLTLTDDDDKELYGRELPLTDRARAALDRSCPAAPGPIFGRHRVDPYVRQAAKAAGLGQRGLVLCAQHLRSAGITTALERTANLPGVQLLAGHKHASTTARYVRPSLRAARDVVAALNRVSVSASDERPQNDQK